jgi:hypothetical protein
MRFPRMLTWLLAAAVLYSLAALVTMPQAQTVLFKLGNVTVAGYVGYWMDVHISRKHIDDDSAPADHLRRAIIVGSTILAVALGL